HGSGDADTTRAADLHCTGKAGDARAIRSTHRDARLGVVQRHAVGVGANFVVDDAAGIRGTGTDAAAGTTGHGQGADAGGTVAVDTYVFRACQGDAINLRVIGGRQVVEGQRQAETGIAADRHGTCE